MDKYTVDLDQVLNDFEYSELTDYNGRHQTTTTTTQTTNNYNKTTPPTTTTTTTTATTKHSINNVFHSLNEYLNSDIKTIDNLPNSNKVDVDKIVQDEVEIDEKPDGNDKSEKIIENNERNESIDDQDNKSIVLVEETEKETIEKSNIEERDEYPPIERKNDEITNNNNDNDSINQQTEISDKIEQLTSINNEEDNNVISIKEEEEEINEKIVEETVNIGEEVLLEKHENIEEINETIDDKTIEVGFNDDIEIDEGELNQYLEQLELEYESQQQQQQQKEEEIKEEPSAERPKDLTLEESDKKIDLVGGPGSTPFNNVYIDKELEQKSGSDSSDDDDNDDDDEDDDETTASISDVSTAELNQDEPPQPPPPPPKPQVDEEDDSEISTETFHDAVETQPTTSQQSTDADDDDGDGDNNKNDWLGNQAPLWIPDNVATNCLHCDVKFTVIKRRHHCRACGLVLCSKCCYLKLKLKYLDDLARVCNKCYEILTTKQQQQDQQPSTSERCKDDEQPEQQQQQQQPNPNNPAEYCSTIPPHQQVNSSGNPVPSVMVPVGVLKRKNGTNSANSNNNNNNNNNNSNDNNRVRRNKSVMFCDGIRPGSDLTNLDNDFSYQQQSKQQLEQHPVIDKSTKSFLTTIKLPPIVKFNKTERIYEEFNIKNFNNGDLINHLKENLLIFAININLFINLRIINLNCCINKFVWCFITNGLINVGQDEIVILLELLDNEIHIPIDIFHYINNVYLNAIKGVTIKEMDLALNQHQQDNGNFLDSKNHAGFLFIRPTFQCLQNLNDLLPQEPYLIGILIHRWETPWAKLFPLRLLLRLGAEYRYYPCPIISYRYRNSCFVEIGHTIINLLADFRNFTYTLPKINGLYITMEEKITKILIPKNRYKQIIKTINNSSDHILAFGGNFSTLTDSHLVCIQDVQNNENSYTTHAINIHNKPRKLTGASFIVFNGALKSSSGLTAKSSIVEDGLMIQITPDHMLKIREDLRNMKNHTIQCGCINSKTDEIVEIIWTEPDTNFNLNVKSPIDNQPLNGIPSIRVHNGKDYINNNGQRLIRWTEVFILKNSDGDCIDNENDLTIDNGRNDPVDISKISESIAKATCNALVKYLDLLISNNFYKIGIRTTLHVENVSYLAGSNNMKLPPIYMKSLDNELIPVLHRITSNNFNDHNVVLELFFRILNK